MTGTIFPSGVKPFSERKRPRTICLFDVDGTLSPARQVATAEMINTLHKLRDVTAIAFVGGSDLSKIKEQLEVAGDGESWRLDCGVGRLGAVRHEHRAAGGYEHP